MPTKKLHQSVPIPDESGKDVVRSVVEFDTSDGDEEIFLLYSSGRENGPGIRRDGKSSPWMTHPNPKYLGKITTDPDIQRFGTHFLNKQHRNDDCAKLLSRIRELEGGEGDPGLISELKELHSSNESRPTYVDLFKEYYPEYDLVGIQGMGDLSMNLWNIAYVNDRVTKEPKFLHLFDEPIPNRVYSCLIKWKDGRFPQMEICDLKFDRFIYNSDKSDPRVVQKNGHPIADKIEFAVYGQRLIRNGFDGEDRPELFHPRDIIHQFSDIRHIFQLTNLNPNDGSRPRIYFGKQQEGDIWFGEAALIRNRNLRRAAIADSIEIDTLDSGLGVSSDEVQRHLTEARYSHCPNPSRRLHYDKIPPHQNHPEDPSKAEWRFVAEDPSLVEVRLRENRYPCTLVGVDKQGKTFFLAWKGTYSKYPGWTLRQAASHLMEYGVQGAILCDEGGDVFQCVATSDSSELKTVIKPTRGQMRAVFMVGRKRRHGGT